jgi:phospho-N-acetylmuramoyl-pentapeptide-transferase
MNKAIISEETFFGLILALGAFLLAMFLTPIYTHFAYKYKFWKKQKQTTAQGDALPIMTKLHAHKFKHVFPTMAGIVGIATVAVVTYCCNWDRAETWLPFAGFMGGAAVGLIDDFINVFGTGKGAAGLRAPVKFAMITLIGLILGWFFSYKLGWTSIYIPFVGAWEVGGVIMML